MFLDRNQWFELMILGVVAFSFGATLDLYAMLNYELAWNTYAILIFVAICLGMFTFAVINDLFLNKEKNKFGYDGD